MVKIEHCSLCLSVCLNLFKSYGVGGVVAHVILVSALGRNPFFSLYFGTFIQLWGLLGQGPGLGLGPIGYCSGPNLTFLALT